jgi:ubiquitin
MNYIIYAYIDEKDKFYYIGRGSPGREKENHKKIKVPSKEKIIILHKNLSLEDSVIYEQKLIKFYGRKCDNGILCNKSIGGHRGSLGVSPWNKGLKCEYVSENNKKRTGNLHPLYGKQRCEETKRKISEKNKGKKIPQEQIQRLKDSLTNRPKTEEHKKNISKGKKGKKQTDQHRNNNSMSKCKYIYGLLSPENNLVEIVNLKKFSSENNLPYSSIHKLSSGIYSNYRGWKLIYKKNKTESNL